MKKRVSPLQSEEGQSLVEFILSMMLLLGFVLFFLQLSFVFAWGNYIHYATFMSARAYLASGPDQKDQYDRAATVLTMMLKREGGQADRMPAFARAAEDEGGDLKGATIGPGSHYVDGERGLSWNLGVRYKFRSRVFLIPFAGAKGGKGRGSSDLDLISESWLGREPSEQDCLGVMAKPGRTWMIDNGC